MPWTSLQHQETSSTQEEDLYKGCEIRKMEVRELQEKMNETIGIIDKKFKCEHSTNNTFLHLIEEIGELAEELNKPNIRSKEIDKKNLEEEIADILLLITKLACIHNIDIEKAILDKIDILKQRHNL